MGQELIHQKKNKKMLIEFPKNQKVTKSLLRVPA